MMYYVYLSESFHMSISYLLAKFGFDTAENGLSKVWGYGVWTPPPQGSTGAISCAQVQARVRWYVDASSARDFRARSRVITPTKYQHP